MSVTSDGRVELETSKQPGRYCTTVLLSTGRCSVSRFCVNCVKVIKFLLRPPRPRPHFSANIAPLPGSLSVLFGSFVTLSSRRPSRTTLTCRLVASVGCVRCPPSPLSGVLNLQAPRALLVFSHSFRTTPFMSNIGVPPGCLWWEYLWLPLPLVALMIRLTRVVDFHFRRPASLCFRWQCSVYLSK